VVIDMFLSLFYRIIRISKRVYIESFFGNPEGEPNCWVNDKRFYRII